MSTNGTSPLSPSMKQYALVPKAKLVTVETQTPGANVREELLELYESYAEAYPNVALQEENHERDRLLRAVSAADHAVQLNPTKQKKRVWLGGLFGGSGKERIEQRATTKDAYSDEDGRLKFIDVGVADDWLLGTEFSLDTANIPDEAHAAARRQLCGSRNGPNVARIAWEMAGTSCMVVTGLGSLAEFKTSGVVGTVQYTSDRQQLLDYSAEQQKAWMASQARAATIGPNLLMVCWGLDGFVVFYRRIAATESDAVTWEAVAQFGATAAVQESLVDLFLEEEGGSALLGVTDLLPLVVELQDQAPAATLAVARLGGFLELVPLPPQMWYGPELHVMKQRRKYHKRKPGEHYAVGKVPDLAANHGGGITVLTTSNYHSDVMGLEAFRTYVDANDTSVEWNQEAYPNGPPSEHVLAAYGTKQETGHQVITFWSVSTILSESSDGIGFSLHAVLTEALDLGKVGPDVTLFVSPTMLRHWRKPRQVELHAFSPSPPAEPVLPRVTTLSVSAPVMGLRFLISGNAAAPKIRAAVLDWNGGVMVLDCDLLEKAVSQSLSEQEYNLLYKNENPDEVTPLVKIVANRTQSIQQHVTSRDSPTVPPSISSLQWFQKAAPGPDNFALAALTRDPCTLQLVFSLPFAGSGSDAGFSHKTAVVPCLENGNGTLMQFAERNEALYLIIQSTTAKRCGGAVLYFCALQELSPGDVVQSCVCSSKLREVIVAAGSLTTAEQDSISDVIEKCKKQLWESELDFSILESIKDDAYVVHEAIFSTQQGDQRRAIRNGDIALYRSVCSLALKRIQTARLCASLAIAGSIEESKAITIEIRRLLIKLGTYELLCRYISRETSLAQFIQEFLPVPPIDLALSFARTADIIPLSLIFFRHRQDILLHGFKVMDEIPLSVAPRSYQHLLPVLEDEGADGKVGQFMAGADSGLLFDFSDMVEYLSRQFDFSAVVDDEDLTLVDECCLKVSETTALNGESIESKSSQLEEWYANRAQAIQHFVSSFGHTSYFSRLALCGLRVNYASETFNASSVSPSVKSLYCLTRFAEIVRTLIADEKDSRLLTSFSTLTLEGFSAMDTKDLVALIMNCKDDSVDLLARYNQYLLPLVKEKMSRHHDGAFYSEIDRALQKFCVGLLKDCGVGEASKGIDLLDAVNVCSKILRSSRTSIDKSRRIVKNKSVLVTLVLSIVDEAVATSSAMQLSSSDQRHILDGLWKMYESLPSALPPEEDPEGEFGTSLKRVGILYNDLIFLDIIVRWPGTNAFALLLERTTLLATNKSHASARHIVVGETAVASLCRSFCEQISANSQQSKGLRNANALLSALLGDINQLNKKCLQGTLSLKHLFARHLFKPLLLQKEIGLLGEFLLRTSPEVIDSESISREVLLIFNDAVYGSGSSDDLRSSLSAAMECQDVLGKWLPELRREFQAIRQYLDAAHHINTVLLPKRNDNLSPEEIRKMCPLDVIEFVLEKNPKCLVRNCDEWEDPSWAKKANDIIRLHTMDGNKQVSEDTVRSGVDHVPPLPGQPVFHLAQLIGLEDTFAVIAVKSRVIHYGVTSKLYGAAAAICRTLLVDTATFNADNTPILDAVAKTVSHLEFDDVATKRELCSAILVRHSANLSASKRKPFEAILNVWNEIEYHDRILQGHPNDAMVSANRFFLDTRKEYSVELGDIFLTLHRQLSDCVMDDALLSALARYAAFWCIGRATRPRAQTFGPLETASTNAIIALATSLILHIRDESILRACLVELLKIFGEQKMVALKTLSSPDLHWTKPDPIIVLGLIGRGYSECGARRAATMTKNAGFSEALQWAVMHSLDTGFDEPVVAIKSMKGLIVDYESAQTLESALALIEKIKSGSESLDNVTRSLELDMVTSGAVAIAKDGVHLMVNRSTSKGSNWDNVPKPAPSPAKNTSGAPSGLVDSVGTLKTTKSPPKALVPTSRSLPSAVALKAPSSKSLIVPGMRNAANAHSQGASKIQAPTKLQVPASSRVIVPSDDALQIPIKGRLKVATSSTLTAEIQSDAAAAAIAATAARHVTTPSRQRLDPAPSSAPAPSPDRSKLLQVGQAAFQTARTTSSPASEERKRLIEEGRLLLQRARSSSADPAQRYFLRSSVSSRTTPRLLQPSPPVPAPVPVPPATAAPPELPPPSVPKEDLPLRADDPDAWDFDQDDLDI